MKRLALASSALVALGAAVSGAFGVNFDGYAPKPRSGPKPKGGMGAERAAKRLKAKLKANKSIPDLPLHTRQIERQEERARMKRMRSFGKQHAMRKKLPGGAASVA